MMETINTGPKVPEYNAPVQCWVMAETQLGQVGIYEISIRMKDEPLENDQFDVELREQDRLTD